MTNQRITITWQRLIPKNWRGIYAATKNDFIFLGKNNLRYLKYYWQEELKLLDAQIASFEERIGVLDGKTIEEIREIATEYEHPDFPMVGIPNRPEGWTCGPEPLDKDSMTRKFGATTFNFCGWCMYCSGSVRHYGYCVDPVCKLIPSALDTEEAHRFNTPCVITNGTQDFLESCVRHLKAFGLADSFRRRAEVNKYLELIDKVIDLAEEKPCFAGHRPSDWFEVGDKIICFIPNDFEASFRKSVFVRGTVVPRYGYDDGQVSICTEEKVHDGDYYDGCGLSYGRRRPEIMHEWEYEYFKTHPDYFDIWIKQSTDELRFDLKEMSKALYCKQ